MRSVWRKLTFWCHSIDDGHAPVAALWCVSLAVALEGTRTAG
jgi:hypothetical protein